MSNNSTTPPNPSQDPNSTTVPGQTPLGDNGSAIGVGQNEFFSSRAKFRNSERFAYRGPDLSYPLGIADMADIRKNPAQQGTYIQFNVFKREGQRADLDVDFGLENPFIGDIGVGFYNKEGAEVGEISLGDTVRNSSEAFGRVLLGSNKSLTDRTDRGEKSDTNAVKSEFNLGGGGIGARDFATGGLAGDITPEILQQRVKTVASDIRQSKAVEKLEETVRLYVPNSLSFSDQAEYEEASVGAFNAITELAAGNAGALSENLQLSLIDKASGLAGKLPGVADNDFSNLIRARLGIATNPRNESLFKGMSRKSFKFDFVFAPRSQEEALMVLNIIEAFRFHMTPELSLGGSTLLAPHEFEITFKTLENFQSFDNTHTSSSGEFVDNPNLPRIGRAFLEGCDVNYSPNERSSFYYDGVPSEITLGLSFKQAFISNRQFILEGF